MLFLTNCAQQKECEMRLPAAMNVAPATSLDKCSLSQITSRTGTKKSSQIAPSAKTRYVAKKTWSKTPPLVRCSWVKKSWGNSSMAAAVQSTKGYNSISSNSQMSKTECFQFPAIGRSQLTRSQVAGNQLTQATHLLFSRCCSGSSAQTYFDQWKMTARNATMILVRNFVELSGLVHMLAVNNWSQCKTNHEATTLIRFDDDVLLSWVQITLWPVVTNHLLRLLRVPLYAKLATTITAASQTPMTSMDATNAHAAPKLSSYEHQPAWVRSAAYHTVYTMSGVLCCQRATYPHSTKQVWKKAIYSQISNHFWSKFYNHIYKYWSCRICLHRNKMGWLGNTGLPKF